MALPARCGIFVAGSSFGSAVELVEGLHEGYWRGNLNFVLNERIDHQMLLRSCNYGASAGIFHLEKSTSLY
jgi:hypothetical protein